MSSFIARRSGALAVGAVLMAFHAATAAADPSDRVARLSWVEGPVALHPAPASDWATAPVNYPMTTGDDLWTERDGRAEVQLGSATARLGADSFLGILDLDSRIAQLRLTQGLLTVNIRSLAPDGVFEIDTPNGAVSLLALGTYRIEVDADGRRSMVTVRHGRAGIATGATALEISEGDAATITGTTAPAMVRSDAAVPDALEEWSESRDWRLTAAASQMFVSPQVIGYDDLDEFGSWNTDALSEPIWIPRVAADWVPFRAGRWSWIEPWGWTWIDDARWGFAPSHYGRWTKWQGQWAWAPGDLYSKPVYAPAVVAFAGAANDAALAGTMPIAWFPLAPGDPFDPGYQASPRYVHAVNAPEAADHPAPAGEAVYINRSVPGALTAVSRDTFVHSQPVEAAVVPAVVSVLSGTPVVETFAHVAPEAASVLSAPQVPAPPASVQNRQVIARRQPPETPVPFAARQEILARQPGRPLDEGALRSMRAGANAPVDHLLVRVVAAPTD